ncbi:MAG: hypothetical protein ACPG80_03400 [Rickettsiales bacterium]
MSEDKPKFTERVRDGARNVYGKAQAAAGDLNSAHSQTGAEITSAAAMSGRPGLAAAAAGITAAASILGRGPKGSKTDALDAEREAAAESQDRGR